MRHSLLLFLALAWSCSFLAAQDPATLSPEAIEARAKAVAEAVQLDAALKERVAPVYATALEAAKAAAVAKANVEAALAAVAAAPGLTSEKRAQMAGEPPPLPSPQELATVELARLEQQLRTAQAGHDRAVTDLQAKEAERKRRSARLVALPGLIANLGEEASKLQATAIEGGADDPPALVEARRIRRAARLLALAARAGELDAEKRQFEAEAELLGLQRDALDRAAVQQNRVVELLDRAVQDRRRADAAADARKADEQAQTVHPLLTALAEANQQVTAAREQWNTKLAAVRADLKREQEIRQGLESRFAEIEDRIKLAGRTDSIGLQLRQEKGKLPSVRRYLARIETRRGKLVAAQLDQLDLEDQRQRFQRGRERVLSEALAGLPPETDVATRSRIEAEGRELLDRRDGYFASLGNDLDAYIRALVDLDTEERQLVKKSRHYATYVNERVLWIRSTQPIWATDWGAVITGAGWFLNEEGWRGVGGAFVAAFERSPVTFLSVALLALLLIALGRPARRRIVALAEQAANNRTTSFAPTAWALAMTVVAAAGVPLLVWHIASQMQATPGIGEFSTALAGGLAHAALLFGASESFRQVMRPAGLAESHLDWPAMRTKLFRRNLAWCLPIILPLAFLLRALTLHGYAPWGFMLDRLLLIAMLLVIAVFLARVLNPTKGALASAVARGGHGRRRFWYALGIAAPVVLVLLAASGYHFTALELLHRLELSLGAVGLAVLVDGLGLRWLLLAKRRLAIAQAKVRREAAKAQAKAKGAEGDSEIQREAPQLLDESLSLASVDAQSRKLLVGGLLILLFLALWGVWGDVLPALRVLEDYKLWDDPTEITRIVNGNPVVETDLNIVTWANVLLALLVVGLTFAAARNIPGLLELAILQRVQAGERYAVTTLVRYLIVTVGVIITFSCIGIGWGKIQWLVAAISVGLGFGLQEIFANFVSGLIILFERPVRIGDLVTVGDVDGYVTRIRMRATTIIDFDRREMIVPNKEFVTSRLVNWTLTDPITRVKLTVGVAYGSDTDLARRLLLQVANDTKLVLDEPGPSALFRKFGESSLEFDLRVFIASRDYWPKVVNNLHSGIDKAFRDAKIEIAFPQRDLHVRTLGPLGEVIDPKAPPAG